MAEERVKLQHAQWNSITSTQNALDGSDHPGTAVEACATGRAKLATSVKYRVRQVTVYVSGLNAKMKEKRRFGCGSTQPVHVGDGLYKLGYEPESVKRRHGGAF